MELALTSDVIDEPKRVPPKVTVPHKRNARSKVTNGALILAGLVDGRTQVARRYTDLVAAVCVDQGGADRMSEAKLQLARRFAALSVQAEQMETQLANGAVIDIAEYSQLTSTLVRVISRLGIERMARDMTRDGVEIEPFSPLRARWQAEAEAAKAAKEEAAL
jgi:hypothetical protein